MRIAGFAASLRAASYVHRLLVAAGHELPAGTRFEVWQGLDRVPPRTRRPSPVPPALDGLVGTLAQADGLILTTPGHSLLPRQLGDALDWMADVPGGGMLRGLPVALVSAGASTIESMWAQVGLHPVLSQVGAVVRGVELTIAPGSPQFDAAGRLLAGETRDRLRAVICALWTGPASSGRLHLGAQRQPGGDVDPQGVQETGGPHEKNHEQADHALGGFAFGQAHFR
ncbi:NADPH-dependent FMN reductase [Planotetraspora thailandica]|uniref:NADPH-dependent FMN reductase n=1 Tax=Planotetraspora thailandica TaxID=487172 RepID=UPI0023B27498|nr:NAD(P)H-dependent oxidoreductase [Planotetraspora thailandica]